MENFDQLRERIAQCRLCESSLEQGVNPVLQIDPRAKILIAGQAPGRKVHESGIPFNDASGDRLRRWMGIDKSTFYDPTQIAILPMAFCYPGKGRSGDLPPRKECATTWRNLVLAQLTNIKLTLLIGQYAIKWHLPETMRNNLTETVKHWQEYPSNLVPLPHPSPRNIAWFQKNPWFEQHLIPELALRVREITGR